jgi:cytochrome b
VWDASTRVFHWVNAISVVALAAIGTAILFDGALGVTNAGKVLLKTVHVAVGYVFALNLAWRLIWGLIGGQHARWRAVLPFGRDYRTALAEELSALRAGRRVAYLGHTPLGRIAVTTMLLLLLVQAGTGLVLAGTDLYMPPFGHAIAQRVAAEGVSPAEVRPYAPETINADAYKAMRAWRGPVVETHELAFYALLALALLHIAAIVATELKQGGTLVSAMITGRKVFAEPPADLPKRLPPA